MNYNVLFGLLSAIVLLLTYLAVFGVKVKRIDSSKPKRLKGGKHSLDDLAVRAERNKEKDLLWKAVAEITDHIRDRES